MKYPNQILQEAEDLLIAKGWCQGRLRAVAATLEDPQDTKPGSHCLIGSLRVAAFNGVFADHRDENFSSYLTACQYLGLFLGLKHADMLVSWNDLKGRNKSEVIEALRRAKELYASLQSSQP